MRSFLEAFRYLWKFTGWMTFAILILLIPVIWQVVKKSDFSFRLPGLVLLGSFCLYATGFTPSLYSLGHAGLSRALNAVRITFQILLVINEVYWMGWLRLHLEKRGRKVAGTGYPWWFYGLTAVLMIVIVRTSPNPIGGIYFVGAYYYIHSGEAYNFHMEYQERLKILRSTETDVLFEPYLYRPWMLCLGELGTDPNTEENRAMASWYGKNSIALRADP